MTAGAISPAAAQREGRAVFVRGGVSFAATLLVFFPAPAGAGIVPAHLRGALRRGGRFVKLPQELLANRFIGKLHVQDQVAHAACVKFPAPERFKRLFAQLEGPWCHVSAAYSAANDLGEWPRLHGNCRSLWRST